MSGSHRHEVERLAPADQAAGEGKCAAQQSRGVAEGAEQVSPRLRGLFPSAPGSSLQRRVDRVAGDANKTAKTVNASDRRQTRFYSVRGSLWREIGGCRDASSA